MVQVWFDWGADLNVAEVEIIQNIQRIARSLPDGVSQPAVLKFDISNIPVAQVVVAAPGMDARVLYQLATDTIEPQLERLPGVSQAFVSGGLVRQFNVNVDPHRLAATGLSLQDVDAAVRRYNALIPSGSLRNADIDFQLMVPTTLQDVAALRRVVLTSRNAVPVYIADIADVEDGAADQTQIVKVDGEPGITVSVARQPGANIVEVVDALRAAVPRLTGLPEGVTLRIAFDQSRYIRAAIQSLTHEAFTGALLTFMVILVFLPNLWNLFIVGIGLPLSVATALILLYFTGQTLNVFTLGGLTLALGRLVDDAIVVRENITRHLARPGTSVLQAVLDATQEVGTAVFASTATTIAEFFPATDESQFSITVQEPQGTSVQITSAAAEEVARVVLQVLPRSAITTMTTNAGTSGGGFGGNQGPNFAQVNVRLIAPTERTASTDELAARVRRALDGKLPGVQLFFSIGGLQRNIVNIGASAPIDVQVLGYDQTVAQQLATQVAAAVAQTPGAADIRINPRGQYPAFTVRVNNEKAALLGLSPTAVANAITPAMSGNPGTASMLIDPYTGAQYGIVIRLMDQYRSHPEDLSNVPLVTLADPASSGSASYRCRTPILLRDIATVSLSSEPLLISRKNQQRVIDVTANVVNRPLGDGSAEIVQRLDRLSWPLGFTYHMAGQTEQQQGAFGSLGLAAALALMLVYMIMASQFQSLVDPFVIMFTVPLGLIGVVWMLLLTHGTLSIVSFMGVITMVGIVVSNGILLVDYANKQQDRGLALREAVLQAGRIRLRPILMTALATILGMIPMAVGLGEGAETNMPLARAVIGGLTVSTGLTLLLIPTLYVTFEEWLPRRKRALAE